MSYEDEEIKNFLYWLNDNFQVIILPKIIETGPLPKLSVLEMYNKRICDECDKPRGDHENWCYRA